MAGKVGAAHHSTDRSGGRDTEAAKTAPVVSTYTFPAPNHAGRNMVHRHRTLYMDSAFAPDGRLWEFEHVSSVRAADEPNLIQRRQYNYGWPLRRMA
ncbi:PQQ-dependent sugar dehydrogenase [Curtobacterium flaccumfaciens]|uniref:PQQ-dependent sugar dehydrogenase n=1 Tax=Curtobacterium flaccumfaciens TaxID=2035 RepID=UPI00215B496D|nr:PQQ-dependent sugar dehydrogenase [Curtobacterium flaccumfaciens]